MVRSCGSILYRWRQAAFAKAMICWLAGGVAFAEDATPDATNDGNVRGIMDNSFLVEEAYNQEAGVVQHIFNAFYSVRRRSGTDDELWNLSFTQEWPVFSQKHQLSYTIPYNFVHTAGGSADGLGDMMVHYRYQAYFDEATLTAFAPRASLILPTGDEKLGFGDDTVGVQVNLPFSTTIGDMWFVHLNAGFTYLPNATSAQNRDLLSANFGASTIYAMTRDTHLMLECVGSWNQLGDPGRALRREWVSFVSPGVRHAFNFANGSQLVIGAAAPIGISSVSPDIGAFLYLSFEHFLPGHKPEP